MNRHDRRAAKALGQAVEELGPADVAAASKKKLVLSGAPPEEITKQELALVLGMAGQVAVLADKLGVGTDKLHVHFDLPSGKHVCFSYGDAPIPVHVH
jgi:hypothetical protein